MRAPIQQETPYCKGEEYSVRIQWNDEKEDKEESEEPKRKEKVKNLGKNKNSQSSQRWIVEHIVL